MKRWCTILLAAVLIFGLVPAAFAVTVSVNGETLNTPAMIENGRCIVPLRAICDAMGADISYDPGSKGIIIRKGSTIALNVGSDTAKVNGVVKKLDMPAKVYEDKTYVPVRFISENFGAEVFWHPDTQSVQIMTVKGGTATVHFIDVGQGDAIYISLPSKIDILIDGGSKAKAKEVVSYLKAVGMDDIDLLIATNPQEEHIGALSEIINSFKVDRVIDCGKETDTYEYKNYTMGLRSQPSAMREQANNQTIIFGGVTLQVLGPVDKADDNLNNNSVVVKLDTGDIEFLFTGDAEYSEEISLANTEAEILKVSCHGSGTASGDSFLAGVKPEMALISVGPNDKQYPSSGAIKRLQAAGASVYRTDINGTVVVSTDGKEYSVKTLKSKDVILPTGLGKFVGSTKSKILHTVDCVYARVIPPNEQQWFDNVNDAKAERYSLCRTCDPK